MLLFKVEVYYIEFQLAENSNLEELKKKKFSKSDTLEEIQTVMKELFGIPALEETRLWNKYTSNTYEQLARLDNTVQVNLSLSSGRDCAKNYFMFRIHSIGYFQSIFIVCT